MSAVPTLTLAQVRLPLAAMVVAKVLAAQSVGLVTRAVAVVAVVAVVANVARSMVILFGMSASVRAAQVKFPLAAMVVANWLVLQSVGLVARAVAVVALPVKLPTKLPAVTLPSRIRLVLKAPLVLPRLIVTSAAPRSAAALGKLLACRDAQVKLPLAAMVVAKVLAAQSVGLVTRAVAVVAVVAVVANVARSMVILFGMSASVRAAQVKFPLAAMVVANWLVLQSVGLVARAVAVVALPVRAPEKVAAVMVPLKVGLLIMVRSLQLPPVPRVMVLPPPLRLPVPEAQVRVVLPWTAVLALEP